MALITSHNLTTTSNEARTIKTYMWWSLKRTRDVCSYNLENSKARFKIEPAKSRRAAVLLSLGDKKMEIDLLRRARERRLSVLDSHVKRSKRKEEMARAELMMLNVRDLGRLIQDVDSIKKRSVEYEWERLSKSNKRIFERCKRREVERKEREGGGDEWRSIVCGKAAIQTFARERNVSLDEDLQIPTFGGVVLDGDERAILSLPPKFAIMGKISHKEVKVETRNCLLYTSDAADE